jgi:hypothetical protein
MTDIKFIFFSKEHPDNFFLSTTTLKKSLKMCLGFCDKYSDGVQGLKIWRKKKVPQWWLKKRIGVNYSSSLYSSSLLFIYRNEKFL